MALYDRPHDDQVTPNLGQQPSRVGSWLPAILAIAIAVALIAWLMPNTTSTRLGDTNNAGPSMETVAPKPAPSTSPAVPTPTPTTSPNTP